MSLRVVGISDEIRSLELVNFHLELRRNAQVRCLATIQPVRIILLLFNLTTEGYTYSFGRKEKVINEDLVL